ncbi:MAG: transcriptional regulator [Oceanospirillaceae bacterium]|nr:transcriptional regulator [Oceanospirillaceae bacterium]MBL35678.1 transcriptional regulator [Oceanospirillaceae bacterium]MBS52207.1 transcriptional regulator [Oceanospirillaceae bacterium]|tara:strand:+ start:137 stop:547 length:411 start_codon:yes stop_codon:yes gene_type:complete
MKEVKKDQRKATLSEKLERGDLFASPCPSREILKHVCSRWGVLILIALRSGTHRFSELRRKMDGVSEKMLAQSLHALVEDGFVVRVQYPVVPPFVEYSLTDAGEEVAAKVADLADWIEVNTPEVITRRAELAEQEA